MPTLGSGLCQAVDFLLTAFEVLVAAQWIFSWVGADPQNAIVRTVDALTDPFLDWLRRRLPFLRVQNWDLSPMAAVLIAVFLARVLEAGIVRAFGI